MKELINDQTTPELALQLGLVPSNEEKGIYHLVIHTGENNEAVLNKMSELESKGFLYRGISKIAGKGSFMVFSFAS